MKKHTIERAPVPSGIGSVPEWRVDNFDGPTIRCYNETSAMRVAKALDLLDELENNPPQVVIRGDIDQAAIDAWLALHPVPRIQFVRATRPALPESEILTRAREAAIADAPENGYSVDVEGMRSGKHDNRASSIRSAVRALRDLTKPLAELVSPPVDPDLIEARKIAAARAAKPDQHDPLGQWCEGRVANISSGKADNSTVISDLLAAIKRGRELGLKEWQASAPGNEARRGLSGTSIGRQIDGDK